MWKRKTYLYALLIQRTLNWDLIYQYVATTWVKSEKDLTPFKTRGEKRVRYSVKDIPALKARSEVRQSILPLLHCFGDRGTSWQNHFLAQNLNTPLVLWDYGDSQFLPCRMTRHRKGNDTQRWANVQISLAKSFINLTAFLFFPFPQPGIWIL